MLITDLKQHAREQKNRRGSIISADRYFRSVETCFDGGACPIAAFNLKSQADWEASLKSAEEKLVYTNDEMMIAKAVDQKSSGAVIGIFDAIVTSTKRDRDTDILETKGATMDPHAPLLWQHIPMQPIGSIIGLTSHTDKQLAARFKIADTALGQDSAVLIEAGALRISHGFEPTKFKPLKDEGWHIEEFEIFEVSVVSIPSNTDAVITQFSREKLHDPMVRAWAGKMFSERPANVTVAIDVSELPEKTPETCGCQTSETKEAIDEFDGTFSKDMPVGVYSLPQSYEWVNESLSNDLNKMVGDENTYGWVVATYKNFAVCCIADFESGGPPQTFKAKWKLNERGTPEWTSELREVEIQVEASFMEKSMKKSTEKFDTPPALPAFGDIVEFITTETDIDAVKHLQIIIDARVKQAEYLAAQEVIRNQNTAVMELLA